MKRWIVLTSFLVACGGKAVIDGSGGSGGSGGAGAQGGQPQTNVAPAVGVGGANGCNCTDFCSTVDCAGTCCFTTQGQCGCVNDPLQCVVCAD